MTMQLLRAGFVFAAFSLCTTAALAIPKAAEDADEAVTVGADVARPRISAKQAKPPVPAKGKRQAVAPARKTKKPAHTSK